MTLEIIVKTNDGRGRGHIGRVRNWIDHMMFHTSLAMIVNKDYADMVPERMFNSLVKDEGWRIDLDKSEVYEKWVPNNRTQDITPQQGIEKYYLSLLDALTANSETRLVYIDDQNAPETLFLSKIGKLIGTPAQDIKRLSESAKICFEIETQIWDRHGEGSMGQTRAECFRDADYLHLSTDGDFMKKSIGVYDFTGDKNKKVIPMGFPLATYVRNTFEDINSNPELKTKITSELYNLLGVHGTKKLVYSSFGAGEGADEVIDGISSIAGDYDDVVFVASNPRNKLSKVAKNKGYEILDVGDGVKKIKLDNDKAIYLTNFDSQDIHLKLVCAADALIQGNGSGTTYEGIAARTPIANVPLVRPGYEQLIKGIGVTACGGGELLLLDPVQHQMNQLKDLTETYGHTINCQSYSFTKDNLKQVLTNLLQNGEKYKDNLNSMQKCFADPVKTADTIKDMASGFRGPQIIQRQGLKPYY